MDDLLDDRNALGMVRLEHSRLHEFLRSAVESTQPDFTAQVTRGLLRELDIHAALEHEFLYPFMKGHLSEHKFKQAIREDAKVEALKTKLQSLKVTDDQFYPTLNELIEQFGLHCFAEDVYALTQLESHTPYGHNHLVSLATAMQKRREEMLSRSTDVTSPKLAAKTARTEHEAALKEEPSQQSPRGS